MIAHRMEWLTENDKIIANADPIEIPAVAAFSLALISLSSIVTRMDFTGEGQIRHPGVLRVLQVRAEIPPRGRSLTVGHRLAERRSGQQVRCEMMHQRGP